MRIPAYLRSLTQAYALESWVDDDCPLDKFFKTIHGLCEMLKNYSHEDESSGSESILVNLVAQFLDADGLLEDYVLANPVASHNLNEADALVPVHKAAAIILIRRYRRAVDRGEFVPSDDGAGATS